MSCLGGWSQEKYLRKIGISSNSSLKPDLDLLQRVVERHAQTIPYQSCGAFLGEPPNLSREALTKKLIDDGQGGMCYETQELLYHALIDLGFSSVFRFRAFPFKDEPFDPSAAATHEILFVELQGKTFLVDVGFGYQSIRSPLEIDLGAAPGTTQEIFTTFEHYRVIVAETYYRLDVWTEENWFPLYRFRRHVMKTDCDLMADAMALMDSQAPIRRRYVKISRVCPEGRVGFHFEPNAKPFICFMILVEKGKVRRIELTSASDFSESVRREIELEVPEKILAQWPTDATIPKSAKGLDLIPDGSNAHPIVSATVFPPHFRA